MDDLSEREREHYEAWQAEMEIVALLPLTLDAIAVMEDASLSAVVSRKIWARMGTEPELWPARLERLSPGQRAIWTTDLADNEVNGAGFEAYFAGAAGSHAPDAAEGYRLLGAGELADILLKAMLAALREGPVHLVVPGQADGNQDESATDLGRLFWEASKRIDLMALQVRYIRQHPDEFVDG